MNVLEFAAKIIPAIKEVGAEIALLRQTISEASEAWLNLAEVIKQAVEQEHERVHRVRR